MKHIALIKNRDNKSLLESGFSLLEILVVLGVMTMLSTVVFSYGRSGENQIILFQEQAKMVSAILRSKNLAIQTYLDEESICGYGVHIDLSKNRLIIFKDKFESCNDSDNRYSGDNEDFEIIDLHERLSALESDFTDVLFIPPDPQTVFDGDFNKKGSYTLIIKSDSVSGEKYISVNNFGQVTAK